MKNLLLTLMCVIGMITPGYSQCTTATLGQFPATTFTPTNSGAWENITTSGYSSEYSVISVTNGNTYEFRAYRNSNSASRFVTITNSSNTVITSGTTSTTVSITWVANFTGTIRMYQHNTSACATGAQASTRRVKVTPPPPSNDNPSGAILLTVNEPSGYQTYSNTSSTSTTTESAPSCAMYNGQDVWFKVVVPNGVTVLDFDTQAGVITDGGMAIYRGNIGSLIEIECDDDDALDGLMPWIYREDFTPGETIYIRFWEYGGGTVGTFKILVSTPLALPVELTQFEAESYPLWNVVKWATASEQHSDYFSLESSIDGETWKEIAKKPSAGNSTNEIKYSWVDYTQIELTYYRLVQYDIDGKFEVYGPISAFKKISNKEVIRYINTMGQDINPSTATGLVIEVYSDGSIRKLIR